MMLDRKTMVKYMADPIKILVRESRSMGHLAQRRDGSVNAVEIQVVTCVDATHVTLELAKLEIT